MKHLISKILLTFLFFTFSQTAVFGFYTDVQETHKYHNAIKNLSDFGRLPVTTDNLFHPEDPLTKKDFYKMLLTYSMADLSQEINLPYIDVPPDSPYAIYIQTALDLKILRPTAENPEFNSNQQVNKIQTLSTLFSALGLGPNYFFHKADFPFNDLRPDSSMAPIAQKAADLKIFEPDDPKKFRKAKQLTKGDLAYYLYKIKNADSPTLNLNINLEDKFSKTEKALLENPNLATLLDVWTSLKKDYYFKDKINDQEILLNAIKTLVDEASKQAQDKYTVFEKPDQSFGLATIIQSEYEGIGILIELINKDITIVAPFKGSPAEDSGLKAKDVIIKIDGVSVVGQTLEEVSQKIKGPKDSQLKITVARDNKEIEFSVTRKAIKFRSVEGEKMTTPGGKTIGYISVVNFGARTYEDFIETAKELTKDKINGLIIDLRNNPGGFMDVAVNIIGLFTKEVKTAVNLEYSDKRSENYKTNGNGLLANYKVVILINAGSASASEIMAGALHDYKIATLIGEKSFGKGSVQQLKQYKDGSIFKFTVSKWLTPDGHVINDIGLTPDKVVDKGNGGEDLQLNAALAEF